MNNPGSKTRLGRLRLDEHDEDSELIEDDFEEEEDEEEEEEEELLEEEEEEENLEDEEDLEMDEELGLDGEDTNDVQEIAQESAAAPTPAAPTLKEHEVASDNGKK